MSAQIIIFSGFSLVILAAALRMIVARNPVHGALSLVLAFVAAAGIWLLLEAEFLALVLILVYVGAVMTLFLFVVMMINLDHLPSRDAFKRYLPLAGVIAGSLITVITLAVQPHALPLIVKVARVADVSNTQAIAAVLYTDYVYAFEVAAVILLAAIIAAISLAFRGSQGNTKKQRIDKQVNTRREDSIKLVKMKPQGGQA